MAETAQKPMLVSDAQRVSEREDYRVPQTRAAVLETSAPFTEEALRRAITRLAERGWNSIFLPAMLDGYTLFPSQTMADHGMRRIHPEFRKWRPYETAFELATEYGLDIQLTINPYLIGPVSSPRPDPALLRKHRKWAAALHPSRKRRAAQGSPLNRYYCPVNPEYRRFLGDLLHAMVEEYPCHGLMIDLRHYPFFSGGGRDDVIFCYCEECRTSVLRDLGFDPAGVDLASEASMVQRWREWQTQRMDQALAYLRLRTLKARRTVRVYGLLTTDSGLDQHAHRPLIHWEGWVQRSMVECLILDTYSPRVESFQEQVAADVEALPENALLLPMLPRRIEDGQAALPTFSKHPLPGFSTRFENWHLPEFDPSRRMAFRESAFVVEADPIQSITVLLYQLVQLVPGERDFAAFLQDLSRALVRSDRDLTVDRLLMVADNIRGLWSRVRDGHLNFGRYQDRILHDLSLAWRLAYAAGSDLTE